MCCCTGRTDASPPRDGAGGSRRRRAACRRAALSGFRGGGGAAPERGVHHRDRVHALAGACGHRQVLLLDKLKLGAQGGGQAVGRPAVVVDEGSVSDRLQLAGEIMAGGIASVLAPSLPHAFHQTQAHLTAAPVESSVPPSHSWLAAVRSLQQ